ncbi:hypothetical protein DNX69_00405 [Rhodopseudomonas palustris]|uniref:Uncharacterized protein n=1 Tax=Rhodopseudomonas palustris TaxID=1076 RepID=A0A323UNG3_RHOPL|nr:hypothetical protein [Rhodopseudomonas palustris]PZA13929.1 hypothetical protein DNX69_00405 [Rhodopseudomonas palustris]
MRLQLGVVKLGLAISAVALIALWPRAQHGAAMIAAQDDPAKLSELQIADALRQDRGIIARQTEAALSAGDPDLARSFVELATAHQVALPDDLVRRVDDAVRSEQAPTQVASRFATGLVTGQGDDLAALSGTLAGDLFVFGDVRDVIREGKHLATGEAADHLILGLAAAGIAVTAATYVSIGAAAPARAGLTLVKDARKVGRISSGLVTWAGRSAREIVDAPALRRAVADASLLRPARTVEAVKAAVRTDKAGGLMRFAKDVGKIGEKAGTRGAFDALKVAENPKDVARAARLATAKGGQTRAIIKLLGRGALLLATGAWNFASWIFSALLMLFSVVTSLKAGTERLTQRWLDRRRRKATKRALAAKMVPQPAVGVASAASEA